MDSINLRGPVVWIKTAVYTYQINWKNPANAYDYASEMFASYLWKSMFIVNLNKLNSSMSIFKGFAKSASYLALCFPKLGTSLFAKWFLRGGHATSLQCQKMSTRVTKLQRSCVSASQCSFNANLKKTLIRKFKSEKTWNVSDILFKLLSFSFLSRYKGDVTSQRVST